MTKNFYTEYAERHLDEAVLARLANVAEREKVLADVLNAIPRLVSAVLAMRRTLDDGWDIGFLLDDAEKAMVPLQAYAAFHKIKIPFDPDRVS